MRIEFGLSSVAGSARGSFCYKEGTNAIVLRPFTAILNYGSSLRGGGHKGNSSRFCKCQKSIPNGVAYERDDGLCIINIRCESRQLDLAISCLS